MGVENSFNNIQRSMLNCSKLEPVHCLIMDLNKSENEDSLKLKIALKNEINEEFLVKKQLLLNKFITKNVKDEKKSLINDNENINLEGEDDLIDYLKKKCVNYYIFIEKVQGTVINDQLFCQILEFRKDEINKSMNNKVLKEFHFMTSTYIDNITHLNRNSTLFSTYLYSLGTNNKNENEFEDISTKKIKIKIKKKTEPHQIYFFCHMYYDSKENRIKYIENISDIEEVNPDLTTNNKVFQINKKGNRLIEGKIISANFSENIIDVKTLNSGKEEKIIQIELNHSLIKNITFNGICYFLNFESKNGKKYSPKRFSHIIISEKTIIKINFLDFAEKNNYDAIKIKSHTFNIINKELIIELIEVPENNYFREKLTYMKKNKKIHSFVVEIYKGRENKFASFINLSKDGYSYEFLYISKN